jgi:hypothetical protein
MPQTRTVNMSDTAPTMRELWQAIMHYGRFDRMPVIHWLCWPETLERWEAEGLPKGTDQRRYFDAAFPWVGVGPDVGLFPPFPEETIEETDEYRMYRDVEGVVKQEWKRRSCIPHFIDFTLKTAADWPEYKGRLQPDPGRLRPDFDDDLRSAERSGRAIAIGTASMMGWIRNWMGVPGMCYLMYDEPDCYGEMVDTLAELTCWAIDQTVPRMRTRPDLGFGWEDICGSSGPLVSPAIFDRYVAPGYRKVRAKLEEHGIGILGIDSDGRTEPLIPHWLEAGVNLQFPLQPCPGNCTPAEARARFGRELRIVGGFNKLVLEKGRAAIDAELEKHLPVMAEGGYILMPDHLITPGVRLADYQYYLDRVRALRF